MPKKINIFLNVIDNLGDIGFAAELVRSFQESFPWKYFFCIWTDHKEKVLSFFEKNPELRNSYSIHLIRDIAKKKAHISLLLFHYPIPENYPYDKKELFLRIDYLSFDSKWIEYHWTEHLDSREEKRIIEIIPSPLVGAWGIISSSKKWISRKMLADTFGLNEKKKWISIFAYPETLEKRIQLEELKDREILLLGTNPLHEKQSSSSSFHFLPFLSLAEFSSIVKESEWVIIRGEVSFISTLQIGIPFLWDMYKEIGGFHDEQAQEFLNWYTNDGNYQDLFYRLNGKKKWIIKLSEIQNFFEHQSLIKNRTYKNLWEELQKYIDKYHISL